MSTVTDEMRQRIDAARAKFAEHGIDFPAPWDGDLDDLERERFDALVKALEASALSGREPTRRDVANAINRARYAPRPPLHDIEAEDRQTREYSYRLADAVIPLIAAPVAAPSAPAETASVSPAASFEDDYIDQLNTLCADFGCPAGSDRLHWLHDKLSAVTSPASGDERGWRPMDSAPKDGTRVLLYDPAFEPAEFVGSFCWTDLPKSDPDYWEGWQFAEELLINHCDDEPAPIRWIPIPSPPSINGGSDAR